MTNVSYYVTDITICEQYWSYCGRTTSQSTTRKRGQNTGTSPVTVWWSPLHRHVNSRLCRWQNLPWYPAPGRTCETTAYGTPPTQLINTFYHMMHVLLLADRTNGRAYATVLRLSVCPSSVTLCIVAKRCVLEQKLLLRAYRKSYMRNRWVPKWMTLTFV